MANRLSLLNPLAGCSEAGLSAVAVWRKYRYVGVKPVGFLRTYLKNKIRVQGKARRGKKAEHTRSIEHFEPFRNAAMGT
jgi:hypothetical protein